MRVSATVCSKGGVGKTATTANLGGLLADAGFRVLLVDLDPQPTLSSYYELSQPAPGGVYELLASELIDRIVFRATFYGPCLYSQWRKRQKAPICF